MKPRTSNPMFRRSYVRSSAQNYREFLSRRTRAAIDVDMVSGQDREQIALSRMQNKTQAHEAEVTMRKVSRL